MTQRDENEVRLLMRVRGIGVAGAASMLAVTLASSMVLCPGVALADTNVGSGGASAEAGVTEGTDDPSAPDEPVVEEKFAFSGTLGYRVNTSSWQSVKVSSEDSGKQSEASAKKSSKSITGISLKVSSSTPAGSVRYKVYTSKGWTGYATNGSRAKSGSRPLQAVKIQLTGDLASKASVYYRVRLAGYGWMGWAKDGSVAGTKGLDRTIMALQVKVVENGQKAPAISSKAYAEMKKKNSGWLCRNLTGNYKLDKKITAKAKKLGSIRACYNWVKKHKHTNWAGMGITRYKNGTTNWWASECKRMMNGRATDCYSFSATFACMVRALGYDATTVCGYVPSASLGWAAHSWACVKLKGKKYYYDPDLGRGYPQVNFYKFTYKTAPTTYRPGKKS